ncbi:polysaccharide biosynthesis protein [Xylanimonas cellulosilytica DSM 15894]|uniref:Polysaccharide biosynthesis protein n=1 Tax=Xylanimonas cellulosilytica (strain DSM 15894 / JCM 12276 / CECT 5975 / KCTC 9989 / LMG 20990 / NBRC 107835 / XIL07) TaxID=446471 RepID=D1BYN2_XYLCX|nr:lipopolysaccharide biosynthesis protein [Xylanimonas cellulosilytica]ACZ31904.1 polysaccharide biosynthesis protein [Xylanimonas cellulosilytica DSM 15894]
MTSISQRGARGAGIVLAGQAGRTVLQLVGLAVLSRLLPPEDFGLIAMVTVFVAFGETIRDFGMATIGLQRRELSHQQASNLWWVNAALGTAAGLALVAATPLIAQLYGDDRLNRLVPLLAIALPLNGMSTQFQVQLSRAMRYGAAAAADLGALAIAIAVASAGAVAGWGAHALVAQTLVLAVGGLVFRVTAARWWPTWPRRGSAVKRDVRDGAGFGLTGILQYLSQNVDTLVLGIMWDPTSVGLYDRALRLLRMPAASITGPLTQVIIPTLNRVLAEGRTVDSVLLRVQRALGFVIVWVFSVTAAIAPWLIPFVLGDAWQGSVPIFQILAVGGAVQVFSTVSFWQFIASNLGKQLFYYGLVTKSFTVALLIGAAFISLEAVAGAASLALVVSWPVSLVWLAKTAEQDSWAYLRGGLRLLAGGAIASLAGWAVMTVVGDPGSIFGAVVAASAATMVYVGLGIASRQTRGEMQGALRLMRTPLRREETPPARLMSVGHKEMK